MSTSRWSLAVLAALCVLRTHDVRAQYTPPVPAPICEICAGCAGCVPLCRNDRSLSLSGIDLTTASPPAAGALPVAANITLPELVQLGSDNAGRSPQCDCEHGDEVYFAAAGEDHTTGLTTEALDASSNPRVRAQMCTAEVVSVTRPNARCAGTQAPFVVDFTTPTSPPTYAWDEFGIQEACLEPDNPCPADYTHNGSGTCTATSIDTSTMVTESESWSRESRSGDYVWVFGSSVAWTFPNPSSVPALTCSDGSAPSAGGLCPFVHNAISRYRTRAALQTARGTSLDTEAPDFFGTNATHTLTVPDPVVSRVGLPPPEGGSLSLSAAFPRINLTPAMRTTLLSNRSTLAALYAYVAFGDDMIDLARGAGSRAGGRPYNQLGTNAVHLLQDIRPPQFFETEINVCSPDTTYDTTDAQCEGTAYPIRLSHPAPSSSPSITCQSGYTRYAITSDYGGIQVGWECWDFVYRPDSDPDDMDDETAPGTVSTTYSYYPNTHTRSIRTYNDAELRRVTVPTLVATSYDTRACRFGFPAVIEDADTGNDITVCFTNGRWSSDDKYAGIVYDPVPPSEEDQFEAFFPDAGAVDTGYNPSASTPNGVVEIVRSMGPRLRYTMP